MTRVQSYLSYALFVAISCVVCWQSLARTFSLALHNDEYTHLLLIIPISASLVVLEWRSRKPAIRANFRASVALLVAAVFTAGWERWWAVVLSDDGQLSLSMLALVLWWVASFVFCFGAQVSRFCLFPLAFLFWMVPVPSFALNAVIGFLQAQSTIAARLLFSVMSIPVSQQGFVLSIPGVNIEVARECSSIRSSVMLLVASMVLAQLSLRSPWSKAVVIAATVPLSIAKNALRIVTLSMLGTRVDPAFLTGRLHHHGGIMFFMISLAVLVLLLWILRRAEERRVPLELNPLKLQQFHLQDRN
jgi:exosortase